MDAKVDVDQWTRHSEAQILERCLFFLVHDLLEAKYSDNPWRSQQASPEKFHDMLFITVSFLGFHAIQKYLLQSMQAGTSSQ